MKKCAARKILLACLVSLFSVSNIYANEINDSEVIKIAVLLAKTGNNAISSESSYKIIKLAAKEINESGGLLGKNIELVHFDTQSTPLGARSAANKILGLQPVAVIGPSFSSTALGAAPILQENKVPMITTWATNPDVTQIGNYIFRVCFIDSFQGSVMAKYATEDLNAKTAVVLTNTRSRYSSDLAEFFKKSFQKNGGKIIWERGYSLSTVDYRLQLMKTKQHNPDVVFLPGYERDSATIIKQARELGITSTFLGGDGWELSMYKFGGNVIDGSYFSSHWHKDDPRMISKSFVKRVEKEYGKADIYALSYDAVYLLADSIKRAKSLDPHKVQRALATTKDFPGVTGKITFDENGDPINKAAVILKFDKGEIVYERTIMP